MRFWKHFSTGIGLAIGLLAITIVAPAGPADPSAPDDDSKPLAMSVSPKAAPIEAFHWRLLPLDAARTPGDAVPIYLRLAAQLSDEAKRQIDEKSSAWSDCTLDALPMAEARGFVDQWSTRLKQMDYAARRQTAQWNYTLPEESENAFSILLPDVQEIRRWSRLLALKARVEIAEKKYDAAIRSIETGLSMAQQVAEGPFLINGLVGIAIANQFLGRLEELISQPDAPNLYWALTALPRPLVNLRKPISTEQLMGGYMLPELNDLDSPRTDAEWAARLSRLHARWNPLVKTLGMLTTIETDPAKPGEKPAAQPVLTIDADFSKFQAAVLPEANAFLKARGISSEDKCEARLILMYIAAQYHEIRDDAVKGYYLPYSEATEFYKAAEINRKAAKGAIGNFFTEITPVLSAAHLAETRLDRRVAALRVIEAIRMYAAANKGSLPASLNKITAVPVPVDPLTNRPFAYSVENDAAILSAPLRSGNAPGLSYHLSIRH